MKILIIRFSSIGDIVLTSPIMRCLKQQFPDTEVHYLTKEAFYPIVADNPYIDRVHLLNKDVFQSIKELKEFKFDYIIDLHVNLRSFLIKTFLQRKSHSFPKLNFKKWILVNLKKNYLPNIHIVDRYFATLKSLNIKNDDMGLEMSIMDNEEIDQDEMPFNFRHGYIVFAIGAAHRTKSIPLNIAKEIGEKINHPIVIVGGKKEFALAHEIEKIDHDRIINKCGILTLGQSASLIKKARLVITPDTGMMHIASAFNKYIVSIWGNTVPELGMYPYMPQNKDGFSIHEVKNLKCRPCSKIGFQDCPKDHFNCMNKQDVAHILEQIESFWNQKKN